MTQYSEDLIPLNESESESDVSDDENSNLDEQSNSNEDSDSEPECVSFLTSRENKKQSLRLAAEAIKVQKDDLKRKRKEVLLQNVKQREEKRQKLASKRLPDDILANLDDDVETTEAEDKNQESEENSVKETEPEIVQTAGNITFKCKVLPSETQKLRYIPEKVAHFKEQLLYGNRIRREKSNRHAVLKREKQCSRR